jgi:hypothetical protein
MKISTKLILEYRHIYSNHTRFGPSENNKTLLLIILFLYHNGKINKARFLALSKQIKENKMDRRVNTFHCTINDKWYNDESILNIYLDVFYSYKQIGDIEFNDALPILQLHTGKNKNYTIDWFFYEFIEPIIEHYESSAHYYSVDETGVNTSLRMMNTFGILFTKSNMKSIDDWKYYNGGSGYCCEEHDGDYDEYCASQYVSYVVNNNKKTLREDFSVALNSLKDPSYLKNPVLIAKKFIL